MKHLSFHILFFCIFLPPVLYIFSIQALEGAIEKKWTADLESRLISSPSALLQGRIDIADEIKQNIDLYFTSRFVTKWGAIPRIIVKTKTGRLLYPKITPMIPYPFDFDTLHKEGKPGQLEALKIARNNLKIMEEGISLSVAVRIPRNTWFANSVLVFYIFVFSIILYTRYRANVREADRLSLRNQKTAESAYSKLKAAQDRLKQVTNGEKGYQKEIDNLQAKLAIASEKVRSTEDEALAEMEAMEKKLHQSIALREKMENEVARLRHEFNRFESSRKATSRKQDKQVKSTMKRFGTLYKNLRFNPRAVEGFLNLQSDLQLKAEEIIHNINEDSSRLTVKRKVFLKKSSIPLFESEFAYKGRIYWKRSRDGNPHILAIGTKNTQAKDLAYLENLKADITGN